MGEARQWMRGDLRDLGMPEPVLDDAVLILSELLSNAWRHGRPLHAERGGDAVRVAWRVDGRERLIVEVTDGGGPTRPLPATPSVTARGGRGLNIITALADDWGVRNDVGEVTVWAALPVGGEGFAARLALTPELVAGLSGLDTDLDLGDLELD